MADLIKAGFFICQMYGLTETVGDGAWNNSQDLADIHSVGLRDPKREYKLDDGELCIRGDSVMMGYYKDPRGHRRGAGRRRLAPHRRFGPHR